MDEHPIPASISVDRATAAAGGLGSSPSSALPAIRLVHVTTVPESLFFLAGQVRYMKSRGLEVSAISSPAKLLDRFSALEGVPVEAVEMTRRITPYHDLKSLVSLYRLFRRLQPHIVHAHTPKAGLLAMIAARMASVPIRVYHIRGLPLMGARAWKRYLLKITERWSCRLAQQVLCVSHTLRQVVIEQKICPATKVETLCQGSGNGVDAQQRFNPQHYREDTAERIRRRYNIPTDAVVIGYIGRIVRDKGWSELAAAWQILRNDFTAAHLLIVGHQEQYDPVPETVKTLLANDPRVHCVGSNWDTPPFYLAMDVVALPSYREGFPNVLLEAAAMQRPVVTTCIPGCTDAVVHELTGLLVPARNAEALANALRRYMQDSDLRKWHGQAGRQRVLREFQPEPIWKATWNRYQKLLRKAGIVTKTKKSTTAQPMRKAA